MPTKCRRRCVVPVGLRVCVIREAQFCVVWRWLSSDPRVLGMQGSAIGEEPSRAMRVQALRTALAELELTQYTDTL